MNMKLIIVIGNNLSNSICYSALLLLLLCTILNSEVMAATDLYGLKLVSGYFNSRDHWTSTGPGNVYFGGKECSHMYDYADALYSYGTLNYDENSSITYGPNSYTKCQEQTGTSSGGMYASYGKVVNGIWTHQCDSCSVNYQSPPRNTCNTVSFTSPAITASAGTAISQYSRTYTSPLEVEESGDSELMWFAGLYFWFVS
jgi:hypothetical protein